MGKFISFLSPGLRDILLHLINVTLKHGARSTGEPELRQKHYKHLLELIDFVLDGRKSYLESIKDNEKYGVLLQQYESQRSALIYHFGKTTCFQNQYTGFPNLLNRLQLTMINSNWQRNWLRNIWTFER